MTSIVKSGRLSASDLSEWQVAPPLVRARVLEAEMCCWRIRWVRRTEAGQSLGRILEPRWKSEVRPRERAVGSRSPRHVAPARGSHNPATPGGGGPHHQSTWGLQRSLWEPASSAPIAGGAAPLQRPPTVAACCTNRSQPRGQRSYRGGRKWAGDKLRGRKGTRGVERQPKLPPVSWGQHQKLLTGQRGEDQGRPADDPGGLHLHAVILVDGLTVPFCRQADRQMWICWTPERSSSPPDCSLTDFIPDWEEDEGETRAMKASESPTLTGCSVEFIWTTGTGTWGTRGQGLSVFHHHRRRTRTRRWREVVAHVSVAEDNGSVPVQRCLEGEVAFSLTLLQPHPVPLHHKHFSCHRAAAASETPAAATSSAPSQRTAATHRCPSTSRWSSWRNLGQSWPWGAPRTGWQSASGGSRPPWRWTLEDIGRSAARWRKEQGGSAEPV